MHSIFVHPKQVLSRVPLPPPPFENHESIPPVVAGCGFGLGEFEAVRRCGGRGAGGRVGRLRAAAPTDEAAAGSLAVLLA